MFEGRTRFIGRRMAVIAAALSMLVGVGVTAVPTNAATYSGLIGCNGNTGQSWERPWQPTWEVDAADHNCGYIISTTSPSSWSLTDWSGNPVSTSGLNTTPVALPSGGFKIIGLMTGTFDIVFSQDTAGTNKNTTTVTIPHSRPTISSVAPSSGPEAGGTSITITGTNFASGATVTVGGSACTSVSVSSSTSLTCTTPAGSGSANVVVTNVGTTSRTLTNGFVFGTAPTVSSASPANGPASGGTSITITGTDFVSGATVTVGGAACTSVVFVSATSLTCTTPAGTAGARDIVVTNPSTLAGTGAGAFTFDPVPTVPTVSSVSPANGPASGGTSISITGADFVSGATVTVGGAACTSVVFVSATSLTCTTPAGTAGARNVVVTNPDLGVGTGTGAFTYLSSSGGGGGGGSSSTPLAPIPPGSNPNIPTSGLPLGDSVLLVNGEPKKVVVRPDAPKDAKGIDVEGDGFTMKLAGLGADGQPLGLTSDGALILQQDRTAAVEGTGFLPNSDVNLYTFSTPRFLGTVKTDASGTFKGTVPLPMDIPAGRHTLQSNGLAPNGAVRSLSLGVLISKDKVRTAKATLYFESGSFRLDATAKASLSAAASKIPKSATIVSVRSIGYVQGTAFTSNDLRLSKARAVNAAAFLKRKGVRGMSSVAVGRGVAKESGSTARRVEVVITYTVKR